MLCNTATACLPVSPPKWIDMSNMETLKQQEEKEEDEINQSAQEKTSISFPIEIIQEILSRLPVKPILRFRSVSKQWLSLISHDPCFPKLHFNHSLATEDRTSFFISAYDTSTNERHFMSAPLDGGPVTHLITLNNARNYNSRNYNADYDSSEAEHLNGLVFFTSRHPLFRNFAFVVNPASRKVFNVPPPFNHKHSKYFFGFDESNSEHKILSACCTRNPETIEFMIFSLSAYSWRHIPVDLKKLPPVSVMIRFIRHSVCVNSVIHLMVDEWYKILAFDLSTEKFSSIKLPRDAIPREVLTDFTRLVKETNVPFFIKDNELLGVVCHDVMVETNEMHVWVLQDYANRVWVRETVTPSVSWTDVDGLETTSYPNMADLVCNCRRLSRDMVDAFILDRKTKSFKLVNFHMRYEFLHSETLKFRQVRSYVESMLPLREE